MKVQDIVATMSVSSKSLTSSGKSSTGFSNIMNNAGTAAKGKMASAGKKQPAYGKQTVSNQKAAFARNNGTAVSKASSVNPEKEVQNTFPKTQDAVQAGAGISDGKEILPEAEELFAEVEELFGAEELTEALELIGTAIMGILGKDLQVDEEELNRVMEVLGLSCIDLFQTDNLKQLVMELQGAGDITEVLMNDDLSTMLTQVLQDITTENIAWKTEMPEQNVEQLIQEISKQTEVSIPVIQEEAVTEEAVVQGNEQLGSVNQKNDTEAAVDQKETSSKQEETQSSLPDVSVVKEVSEEKGSLSREDFGQSTQKDSDLAGVMVNNIASSTVTETVSADGTVTMTTVEMRQVVIQIVQQIKVVIRPEQTDMHMTLHPEHLGRLQLAVTSKDGIMTANFVVQNEMVRNALEAQIQELKDAFTEQGLKVEAVEVTVSTFEFAQGDQAQEGGQEPEQKKQRGKTIDMESAFLDEVELKESEDRAAAAISGSGNNVDYTA